MSADTWKHQFFYFEFVLNILALPVKTVLAVYLLLYAADQLETEVEDMYPSGVVQKDAVHVLRACFTLALVLLEIYVFRVCQKSHALMHAMSKAEGKRLFDVRQYVLAKHVVEGMRRSSNEGKPIELKVGAGGTKKEGDLNV
ncbi:hypothetical protein M3Y99_00761600 [Aphelenchoides fujianensis]|nr:hypothetical protein M3Y99_00761600 [Aphelenchoides fujianensis]